ncbi:MAG: hypothetical protein FWB72_06010 [Firmicutes bacterium]|nr:hypothetical protein [Bacillota bacterium]
MTKGTKDNVINFPKNPMYYEGIINRAIKERDYVRALTFVHKLYEREVVKDFESPRERASSVKTPSDFKTPNVKEPNFKNPNVKDLALSSRKNVPSPAELFYRHYLGRIYSLIGLYEQSIEQYFILLKIKDYDEKINLEISKNFLALNLQNEAMHYLEKYFDREAHLPEDYLYATDEFLEGRAEGTQLRVVYPPAAIDFSKEIDFATFLMREGEYKKAISILEKVTRENRDYFLAQNHIAYAHYCDKKFTKAINVSLKVYKADKQNIYALCNLVSFYEAAGDRQNTNLFIKKLMAVKTDCPRDHFKMSAVFADLKMHTEVANSLDIVLKSKPFSSHSLMMAATAYINLGQYKTALGLLQRARLVDRDNYGLKYLIDLAVHLDNQTTADSKATTEAEPIYYIDEFRTTVTLPLHYVMQVPYEVAMHKLEVIKLMLTSPQDAFDIAFANKGYEHHFVRWAFTYNNLRIRQHLIEKLSKSTSKHNIEFLKDLLIGSKLVKEEQKEIIYELVKEQRASKICVVVDGIFKKLLISYKDDYILLEPIFRLAYALTITSCTFIFTDFETDIYKAFLKILRKTQNNRNAFKCPKALAACILYLSNNSIVKNVKHNKEIFPDLFSASFQTFEKYLQIIENRPTF